MSSLSPVTPLTLTADDGHRIHVESAVPPGRARAAIHIFHGLGEYSARYRRFATTAVDRGICVVTHDHRGHGEFGEYPRFFGQPHGWQLLLSDARVVQDSIRTQHAALPIVLLGHSMGSYLAQDFAMQYGSQLAALILSGSTWSSRLKLWAGNRMARIECHRLGAGSHSPWLDQQGLGVLNKAFEPARTSQDWLSSDPNEVDRYRADPLCGGPYTAGLWRDLTGGLLTITRASALTRIPAGLPVLITGGADDPLGGAPGMRKLALRYAQTGHTHTELKIYAGGRHEMLNETNRDQVMSDWLDWVEQQI